MSLKQLIINADDFNSSPERNLGILEAAKRGIVTSTTVISNLPFDSDTANKLKVTFKKGIGIHLNITRGAPVSSGIKTLVDQNGQFFNKQTVWKMALLKSFDPNELRSEFSAQIEILKDNGISPSHIDSNNHLHIFPVFADIVSQLANKYKIPCIRVPRESFNFSDINISRTFIKKYFIYSLSLTAKKFFKAKGLCFTEHFNGIAYPSLQNRKSLIRFINHLPNGTTELMCHPGYASGTNTFSNAEREKELSTLTDTDIINVINKNRIRLISFADLTV